MEQTTALPLAQTFDDDALDETPRLKRFGWNASAFWHLVRQNDGGK